MKKTLSILLCLVIIFGVNIESFAIDSDTVNNMVNDTAEYIYKTVSAPQVGSIGGEWAVLGLARSGVDIDGKYFETYYQAVKKYVENCNGVLHDKKYTEYSRVVVALTAIGRNPDDVAGYNLLTPLGDYKKTIWQGINGSIWALIALDSGNYKMPQNTDAGVQATRGMYINHILENQTSDGGWALSGDTADPDITAMALQALAKYQDNEKVKATIQKALACMSKKQNQKGGFASWDTENFESCAQMIVALCELGISIDDPQFVKNGNTMLDNLFNYYIEGKGFRHTFGKADTNQMATEQGFYSLVALKRFMDGKNSLYRMDDVTFVSDNENSNPIVGLQDKNADVRKMDIVLSGKTFADISTHKNKIAIEALAQRNIINGKSDNAFEPDSTMTRAEFATIIVRGLGLADKGNATFFDVTVNDWFYNYVNTAYFYGIVNGLSKTEFNPNGTITREEAAVMVARAAKLCGMNTEIESFEARNILSEFMDYVKASDWAIGSLAFCYDEGILSDDVMEIKPKEFVVRAEIAQMLYSMLGLAKLL